MSISIDLKFRIIVENENTSCEAMRKLVESYLRDLFKNNPVSVDFDRMGKIAD
jgi:hypothetical protein